MTWNPRGNAGVGKVPARVVAAIMGALATHLAEETRPWRLRAISPAAPVGGHLWALAGRRDIMGARRYVAKGRRR